MSDNPTSPCFDCKTVCGLEQLANRVVAQLPVAGIEAEFRQDQLDTTGARVEGIEMTQLESDIVHEVVGVRVGEPDPHEYIGALDDHIAALDAKREDRTYMLRAGGAEWVAGARRLASECIQNCSGPRRGLRILQVVIPLPFGLGKAHCGSDARNHAESYMEIAEIGITEGLMALESDSSKS